MPDLLRDQLQRTLGFAFTLETARREHSAWLFFLGVLPEYDAIRSDPRYDRFVRAMARVR